MAVRRGFTVSDFYWGKQKSFVIPRNLLYRDRYSEFPLYLELTDESNVAEKSLKLDSVCPRSKSG